jgi:hypothetical protein
LLQKLQGLDLSVLNGSIKITFSAKEEKWKFYQWFY